MHYYIDDNEHKGTFLYVLWFVFRLFFEYTKSNIILWLINRQNLYGYFQWLLPATNCTRIRLNLDQRHRESLDCLPLCNIFHSVACTIFPSLCAGHFNETRRGAGRVLGSSQQNAHKEHDAENAEWDRALGKFINSREESSSKGLIYITWLPRRQQMKASK